MGQTATEEFQARLLTPVASFSKPGSPVRLQVAGPLSSDDGAVLPAGSLIEGVVRDAKSIGFGVRRERTLLEFDFRRCVGPTEREIRCNVSLVSIDNARETVVAPNRMQGILAASHPWGWLNGLWFRPGVTAFGRSAAGLTGVHGMISSNLLPGFTGAAVVIGLRLLLFRMPDAEIVLPGGTDLVVRVEADAAERIVSGGTDEFPEDDNSEVESGLRRIGGGAILAGDRKAADLINIALLGSREDLLEAFTAAGWIEAEAMSARTFRRTYAAFAAMNSYKSAPVSALYYQGRLPDLVLQKSFNSLAKRHHVRFWESEAGGKRVWLGAATHDVGINFEWSRMTLNHRIDPRIDRERRQIVNDLNGAGCIRQRKHIERPDVARREPGNGEAVTDGDLVLITPQPCQSEGFDGQLPPRPKTHAGKALARRMILETRYYVTRGSAYYWAYRAARWGFDSQRDDQ